MTSDSNHTRRSRWKTIAYGLAGVFVFLSGLILLSPAKNLTLPPEDKTALHMQTDFPPLEMDADWVNLFDISRQERLEKKEPPKTTQMAAASPTPKPEAIMAKYVYLGGAKSQSVNVALFSAAGSAISLKAGEELEGFQLVEFDQEEATFSKNGKIVVLRLR